MSFILIIKTKNENCYTEHFNQQRTKTIKLKTVTRFFFDVNVKLNFILKKLINWIVKLILLNYATSNSEVIITRFTSPFTMAKLTKLQGRLNYTVSHNRTVRDNIIVSDHCPIGVYLLSSLT